ncbi:NAD(P)/FAD-dependent oxidoreductase [Neorhizobium galegae]|uniref:NAD(P)/FAD-dependent oxidoreductase n=1 Tax=Neorhizobium galegae TaxID=399 RepID=UPI00069A8EE7|nr:FAD-dependent oxidoreductase [Neorhizobium galegae]KAB1121231.1 FAD-binding oxidoreductase [Neorhizobium galegae]MCQ1807355.1 FAD-binding oxidoreductase [Neorhizobium galegae]
MMMEVGSLWEAITPAAPRCAKLADAITADVVVVGAGFLGLSSALHAAVAGLDVVLLESHQPGFGASGRNTGFVVPNLKTSLGPNEVVAALGADHAGRLLKLVAGSGRAVFDLISRYDIDCDAIQNGWLQPAHSRAAEKTLHGRMPRLLEAGVDAEWLDRDAMLKRTGLPSLHGGIRVASGGQITPLAYAHGLARAAISAGVRLFGDNPVKSIEPDGQGWRVRTASGEVRARRVLMTTNAMIGNLLPELRASIIPARVFQIATQPLPLPLRETLLPDMAPVADTRRHTFALRWSPDGRLVTGGMVPPLPGRMALARRLFANRLRRMVPDLPEVRVEFSWTGIIAGTLDFLPRMMRIKPGIYAVIGCNGRGVALTTALGREIGPWLAGRMADADLSLPLTAPRPIPFSRISGLGPHLILPVWGVRDAFEARFR